MNFSIKVSFLSNLLTSIGNLVLEQIRSVLNSKIIINLKFLDENFFLQTKN
jgi:hypothetical protein